MSELDDAIAVVAPEIGLPLKVTRWAACGIAGLAVAGGIVWLVWTVFFAGHAAQQKHDVVQAQGQQQISNAGAAAGKDAIPIIVKNYNTGAAIDAQTQEAIRDILKIPGAAQAVDPALDDYGRRAVCMRGSAAGLPECEHLQRSDP